MFFDDGKEDKSVPFVRTIIAGVIIGIVGIYLRFADFPYSSPIADIIFGIAAIIIFKTVFDWMKVPADRERV